MSLPILIAALCSGSSQNNSTPTGGTPITIKSVSAIAQATPVYEAFGFPIDNGDGTLDVPHRVGTNANGQYAHLHNGKGYIRRYNYQTNTWGPLQLIIDETNPDLDISDLWGGLMDDGGAIPKAQAQRIVFTSESYNDLNGMGYDMTRSFYQKFDKDWNKVGSETLYIGGTSGIPKLDRGWAFGKMVYLDSPGHYAIAVVSGNTHTTPVHTDIYVLRTTDYWQTMTKQTIIDGVHNFSETTVEYCGSGRWLALLRNDQGGSLYYSASLNDGATWYAPGPCKLGWDFSFAKIPYMTKKDGLLYILYQDRDNGFMMGSFGTSIETIFSNLADPPFNGPELYYFNDNGETSGNPKLGYGSMAYLPSVSKWYVQFSYEVGASQAVIKYTLDDLVSDPAAPVAPPSLSKYETTGAFNVQADGYTMAQLGLVRYFELDVATDAGFTAFVTAKKNTYTGPQDFLFHNFRMTGLKVAITNVPAGTYYVRIRACNNAGKSAWTSLPVTTT